MPKNGGKRPGAGRKKGSKAAHTIEAEIYRQYIIKRVIKEKAPIVAAMIKKAKKGDVMAFKELNDRALGKAMQPITGEGGGPVEVRWMK